MNNDLKYKYVSSDYIEMTIAVDSPHKHKGFFENWQYMIIGVYSKIDSPYGWTKRKLQYKPFGLERKNFKNTKDIRLYIENAVKKVYKDFPQNKIDNFYNNVIQELSWI